MSNKDEGAGVPPQSKGSWSSFLKSIASFNGDLASLTAPPFILSTTSLVEFSAYWTEHPGLFVAPTLEKDPAKRAVLVLKWFLSTLKQSYASRSEKLGSEKKPLNPFLGELFLGQWEDANTGVTQLVSEQVSHHPPVTAYCIWNEKHGIRLQGYNAQKASFSRTIHVKQIGHALLSFTPPGSSTPESYLITLPSLHIESLIYGSPFVELDKQTHIVSSTGYVAKIDYSGRGWLSGKKNSFSASLWKDGDSSSNEKHPMYTIDGCWTDSFSIKDDKKHEIDTYDGRRAKTTPLTVAPLENQDQWESRRAWSNVARSIVKGDMDSVSHHKATIENAQRELRKKEKSENREWERRFFTRIDQKEPVFEHLAKTISHATGWAGPETDKTGGVWRFDPEKARNARPPFHGDNAEGLGLGGSSPVTPVTTKSSTQSGR